LTPVVVVVVGSGAVAAVAVVDSGSVAVEAVVVVDGSCAVVADGSGGGVGRHLYIQTRCLA
jgi:type 1 fimbria pilin